MAKDEPRREGFVSPDALPDDAIDLAAREGTPEYERAQEEVMIRGATDAERDFDGVDGVNEEDAEEDDAT
jgi:hypothetical protein